MGTDDGDRDWTARPESKKKGDHGHSAFEEAKQHVQYTNSTVGSDN